MSNMSDNTARPKTDASRLSVMLSGARGTLGQAIERCVARDDQSHVVARYQPDEGFLGQPLGDVIIDVSHHTRTAAVVAFACQHARPILIGTTALSASTLEQIEQASQTIPVCVAANFSASAWAFEQIAQWAAIHLPSFQIALREAHHIHKQDAPSGTALRLQSELGQHRSAPIPIESVRQGEIVGQHDVCLQRGGERLSIHHEITDRDVYAQGALTLAHVLAAQAKGRYSVGDLWRKTQLGSDD